MNLTPVTMRWQGRRSTFQIYSSLFLIPARGPAHTRRPKTLAVKIHIWTWNVYFEEIRVVFYAVEVRDGIRVFCTAAPDS
jgi:hypothetical protein